MRRSWWLVCAVVGLALFTAGVGRGQYPEVKRWADALCTGCIGLSSPERHH